MHASDARTAAGAQLIGKLAAQLEAKKKELAAFTEKYKIRVRNNVRSARARLRRRCGLAALRAMLSADPSPRITNQ